MSNHLINPDIAPTTPEQRTWRWYHYLALWLGMVIAVPAYMLASGFIEEGMSPGQAVTIVLLGNLVVLVPILLIGHAGAKYGIPFPVLAHASFGTTGARLPALARALVACGWYGIQTWIGGNTLLTLVGVIARRNLAGEPIAFLGIGSGQAIAFAAFWLAQLVFVEKDQPSGLPPQRVSRDFRGHADAVCAPLRLGVVHRRRAGVGDLRRVDARAARGGCHRLSPYERS